MFELPKKQNTMQAQPRGYLLRQMQTSKSGMHRTQSPSWQTKGCQEVRVTGPYPYLYNLYTRACSHLLVVNAKDSIKRYTK
jgi:hypothetical protein